MTPSLDRPWSIWLVRKGNVHSIRAKSFPQPWNLKSQELSVEHSRAGWMLLLDEWSLSRWVVRSLAVVGARRSLLHADAYFLWHYVRLEINGIRRVFINYIVGRKVFMCSTGLLTKDWHNVDIWYIHRGDRKDSLDIDSISDMRERPKIRL